MERTYVHLLGPVLSFPQLIDIDSEGYMSLMDDSGTVREDVKIDEKDDLGKDIKVDEEREKASMLPVPCVM